jgi:hypothetical protein
MQFTAGENFGLPTISASAAVAAAVAAAAAPKKSSNLSGWSPARKNLTYVSPKVGDSSLCAT